MTNFEKTLQSVPNNLMIVDTMHKAHSILNKYKKILVSVSGGSDSDIMIDLFERIRESEHDITYVWFDTGIEYQATKDHLKHLEQRYGIEIKPFKAKIPSPLACKLHGQPFLSKYVSQMIGRLQKHCFDWSDKPYDDLIKQYPKCKSGLRWWCNNYGDKSRFNIDRTKKLKEFMISNPPTFKISAKCCDYSKKAPAKLSDKKYNVDIKAVGVRRSEGGIRSVSYDSCFTSSKKAGEASQYRPLFFWTDKDKAEYKEYYKIEYSACYEVYGLSRTGCAGCPYGSKFEDELNVIDTYEPNLSKAVRNIFKDSYEYTRAYRSFKKKPLPDGNHKAAEEINQFKNKPF